MAGSSTLERQVVRLLDADGRSLTIATTRDDDGDGAVALDEVEEPGVLLNYYFGRGERIVVIEIPHPTPTWMAEGTLETWWVAGARIWHVYVDRPLITLGPDASARPEPTAGSRQLPV